MTVHYPGGPGHVYVVAHRGFSGKAPENTLAAFNLALDAGVDAVELDVRLAKDGEVVVIHDQKVDRTTDGRGRVQEMTFGELQALDAGSWFAKKFSGERIPSLEEVLSLVGRRAYVNVEIKSDGLSRRQGLELEQRCLDVVVKNRMADRVIFTSFDHRTVKRIKHAARGINVGILYNIVRDLGKTPASLAARVGAMAFICSKRQVTKRIVRNAHDANLKIAVYTINTTREVERMLRYGVDAVITDHPDVVLGVIGRQVPVPAARF